MGGTHVVRRHERSEIRRSIAQGFLRAIGQRREKVAKEIACAGAEGRSPILRATSPMLIPGMKNLLDLKFGSTRTDHHSVCRQGNLHHETCTLDNLDVHRLSIRGLRIRADLGPACQPRRDSMPAHQSSAAPSGGPADAKVEFQNDSVVVVRIHMAPHEKTPMHDIATARLVVWLTDAHLRDTHPDGTTNETHRRAGEFDWVPEQRHAGENLSHEPIEFLAISPKTSAAAAAK